MLILEAYTQDSGLPIQYQMMAQYCNMWRNYDDIQSEWLSVAGIINFWGEANGVDYNNFVNVARPGMMGHMITHGFLMSILYVGAINDPDQASMLMIIILISYCIAALHVDPNWTIMAHPRTARNANGLVRIHAELSYSDDAC